MALKIMMFSDYICPFCYVGFETIRRLKPNSISNSNGAAFRFIPIGRPREFQSEKLREAD